MAHGTLTRDILMLLELSDVTLSLTGCLWGLKTGVQKLQRNILSLQEIIPAAEEHRHDFPDSVMTEFLRKVKEVVDEADYLLRGFGFERQHDYPPRRNCWYLELLRFYTFKIRSVNRTLDDLQADFRRFHATEVYTTVVRTDWGETTPVVNPFEIIGREEEKEKMIQLLISTQEPELRVIPVVGIGGGGKTALAQSVFNDERVIMHFELMGWAYVAGRTSLRELKDLILKAWPYPLPLFYARFYDYVGSLTEPGEAEQLFVSLVCSKRYLLVLDDVHDIDQQTWSSLKHLLMASQGNGSRIIVTTRSNGVAEMMGRGPAFELQGLAARNMGAMLFHETIEDLHTVRNSDREIWEIRGFRDRLLPDLRSNYDCMPYHLRQCFKFCSFYPKDYEFDGFKLIRFWEAYGLIDSTTTGMNYLKRLWSLSLLKECNDEAAFCFKYKMPQLIHDLATCLVHGDLYTVKPSTTVTDQWSRHLRIVTPSERFLRDHRLFWERIGFIQTLIFVDKVEEQSIVESFIHRCRHLQVFISRNSGLQATPRMLESLKSLKYLDLTGNKGVTEIPILQSLKTLILEGCGIKEVPRGIEGMESLEYLDLTGNEMVDEIPNSICKLQILEALKLEGCTGVEKLPRDIKNLSHLTMLSITTKQLFLAENGVGRLTSLRYLSIIRCPKLKYLPQGIHLLASLTTLIIRDCNSLTSLPRSMKYLIALETLVITNCPKLRLNREVEGEDHLNAVGLSLHRCCLTSLPLLSDLPQWLVRKSSQTLKFFHIEDCQLLKSIPNWFTGENFTSLKEVEIVNCKNLWHPQGLKTSFSAFVGIKIEDCPNLEQQSPSTQTPPPSQIPKSSIGGNRQMMEKGKDVLNEIETETFEAAQEATTSMDGALAGPSSSSVITPLDTPNAKENFGSRKPAQGLAKILSIGTANPANYILQDDFIDYYFRVTKSEHMTEVKEKFKQICDKANVRKRHFVLTEEMIAKNFSISTYDGKSLEIRDLIITIEVLKLALEAAWKAIKEWRQSKSHITHLIFAAVSGGDMLDYHLMKLLGLPPSVKRTMMYLRSSYASGTMLRMAKDIAENNAGSRVLVVSCNISIDTFCVPNDSDTPLLIANATTGDGAAALIVSAGLVVLNERPLFEIVSVSENIVPDSDGTTDVHVLEASLHLHLTKDVPEMIANNIENRLKQELGPINVTDWNSFFWVIHPGGNAIMDRIETQLGLKKEKLWASRHVLSEFGDMSTATVFFALDEMRRKSVEAGKATTGDGLEWGIVFGLGAGITIDTVVLRSFPIHYWLEWLRHQLFEEER